MTFDIILAPKCCALFLSFAQNVKLSMNNFVVSCAKGEFCYANYWAVREQIVTFIIIPANFRQFASRRSGFV